MVKITKNAAAGAVQKKSPVNKTNNKDKVAKPAPANRVAVTKAAAAASKVAKTASAKPQPKKTEESASEDEEEIDDEDNEGQTAEGQSEKRAGVSVFVGNLPSNTKRVQLVKLFKPHAKVLRIRFRKPNGGNLFKVKANTLPFLIAFVDVTTQEEAEVAVQHLNQTKFKDSVLRVNLQKENQAPGAEKRSVFLGSLTHATTDQQLIDTFNCCGEIDYVRTLLNAKGCQGTAFVCFKDAASVEMALELNGGELNGRPMSVQKCKPQRDLDAAKKNALKSEAQEGKKAGKSGKQQFTGAKVADGKKPNQGKAKKGGLSGAKLLAKKVAPRPAKVTA